MAKDLGHVFCMFLKNYISDLEKKIGRSADGKGGGRRRGQLFKAQPGAVVLTNSQNYKHAGKASNLLQKTSSYENFLLLVAHLQWPSKGYMYIFIDFMTGLQGFPGEWRHQLQVINVFMAKICDLEPRDEWLPLVRVKIK